VTDFADLRREWNDLAQEVRQHRDLYYNKQPIISDAEFDELFAKLQKLEAEHPELAVPDSPTMEVGAPVAVSSSFANVEHLEPMRSLDNVFDLDELRKWLERTPSESYLTELKIDGLSINLTYRDGELVQAATRGGFQLRNVLLPPAVDDDVRNRVDSLPGVDIGFQQVHEFSPVPGRGVDQPQVLAEGGDGDPRGARFPGVVRQGLGDVGGLGEPRHLVGGGILHRDDIGVVSHVLDQDVVGQGPEVLEGPAQELEVLDIRPGLGQFVLGDDPHAGRLVDDEPDADEVGEFRHQRHPRPAPVHEIGGVAHDGNHVRQVERGAVDALLPRLLQVLMHLADEFLLRNPGSAGREEVGVDPQSPAVVHPEVDHPKFHESLGLRLRHLRDRRVEGDDPDEFFRRHSLSLEAPGLIPAAQHSNSEIPLSGHETALGAAKPDSSATKRGFRDTP